MNASFVVGLGASAGGLEALERFFTALPSDTGASFVVIVHLSPDFKSVLPELLAKRTDMPVAAVTQNMPLAPNHVYVIPPAQNLVVSGRMLMLVEQQRGPGHPINLPIDLFFRQLAAEAQERAIAVVLSGSGSDGSRGIAAVKEHGGAVLVQDPSSATFDGMPRSALNLALVDHTGNPADLAERVALLCRARTTDVESNLDDEGEVERILAVMKQRTGTDLRTYRPRMIHRRIQRRMAICGIGSAPVYRSRLEEDAGELELLRQDLLIGVTRFFRDPSTFESLQRYLLEWLPQRGTREPLRIWTPACSSGQEAYSIGMVMLEALAAHGLDIPVKIFATDINDAAISRASRATYSYSEVNDVPAALQVKYFRQHGMDYLVAAELRERIIFANHNVVSDPPFTRMDLVSCRNLLIYLSDEGQERVLKSLHYALRPETGLLLLGKAETSGPITDGVTRVGGVSQLYLKTGNTPMPRLIEPSRDPKPNRVVKETQEHARRARVLEAHLEATGTTGALVTPDGRLVELLADPNRFFRLGKGSPTDHLSQLLPVDLVAAFTTAVRRLDETKAPVGFGVRGVAEHEVFVWLVPLPRGVNETVYLLEMMVRKDDQQGDPVTMDEIATHRIRDLEREIQTTRETLQAAIEELQTTNEEQQSTNEELIASNEELQSTNEELHSVNEELYTVNQEYQRKNEDLMTMTADLENLLKSTEIATLYLDSELRVRRFSSGLERVVRLADHDIGLPIREFTHRMVIDFVNDADTVISTNTTVQREIRDVNGAWLLMRLVPYRSLSGESNGVIVTFVEVTRIKHAEETARVMSQSLRDANRSLASQTEQLEEMFSVVARDLRRPVQLLGEQLAEVREDLEVRGGATNLRTVTKTLGHLERMLDDLREVSSHGREPPPFEDLVLESWFDTMLGRFTEQASERGIRLGGSCDTGRVSVARTAAEVAFVNLVENAFEHGATADQPRIDVSCRTGQNRLTLIVSDNGRGIARADQQRVFELFQRLHPKETGGSGVGLVSVRRLVQRAGGTIDVQSRLGEGARFTVVLPTMTAPMTGTRVLVVADDDADTRMVRQSLGDLDLDVVSTIAMARRFLGQVRYDLILLDLTLPDGHGLELLADVRRTAPDAAVVVLSGLPGSIQLDIWDPTQVVAVLKKDVVRPAMLRELIEQHLDLTPASPEGAS